MKKICILFMFILFAVVVFSQEGEIKEKNIFDGKVITLSESKITLKDLLEKISAEAKITLIAGKDNDWRVSEREVIVFCDNSPLEGVLQNIAAATKLVWVKEADDKYVLCYDPSTDLFIDNLNSNAENNRNAQREKAINDLFREPENLETLHDDDPIKYLLNATGLDKPITGFIDNVPGLKQALVSGTPLTVSGTSLSQEAINNYNLTGNIIKDVIKDGVNKNDSIRNKRRVERGIDGYVSDLPQDLSKVTIEVNGDNSPIPGGKALKNLILGDVIVKVDGQVKGFLPIINTQNPLAKKFGGVLLDLYENPNQDIGQLFASMGGMDLFKDLNKSMNEKIYDDMKNPIPETSFYDMEITLPSKPTSKANAMELLSKALKCPCVCDEYGSFMEGLPFSNIRTEGTVREIIGDINDSFTLTMVPINNQLCFYSIKWFEEIQKLMPLAYINKWKEQYVKDEYLSYENLCDMSNFTKEQLSFGLSKAPELSKLSSNITANYEAIVFLSNVKGAEYDYITGPAGMRVSALSPNTYELLSRIPKFHSFVEKGDGIIKVSFVRFEDSDVITLLGEQEGSLMPTMVQVRLPKYQPVSSGDIKIPSNLPK